ncbi:MAG: DNA replication/repair protein RecF [Lachnospiraceae bacterium]|nr:DNA replication/repair protein RecF [Lachnospiraceae bacterium]
MFIESLSLNNYRNYDNADIHFSNGINILYGDNAQGKTNVLEAIYMLATTKSHRGNKDKEIIRFDCDESHIRASVKKFDIEHRIDMHLRKNKSKGVAIDMVPIRKSADLMGLVNIILFSPEDLTIIKNSPSERRRFMDMELCQLNRIYYSNLATYNKILNQRNNLLKQIYFDKSQIDMLDVWDSQLVYYGIKIIKDRNNFIDMLNEIILDIHKKLTSDKEELIISYDKDVHEDNFGQEIFLKRDMDLRYQSTQIGPHRDDLSFMINGMDVKKFGSQGQQRTVALSLKLAEISLVKKIINDNPILLLDDVMSELDSTRRDALLSYINDIQTIITCTGYDDFIKERLSIDRIYEVSQGVIQQVNL